MSFKKPHFHTEAICNMFFFKTIFSSFFFFFFLTLIVLAITPGIVLTERGLKQLLKLPVLT